MSVLAAGRCVFTVVKKYATVQTVQITDVVLMAAGQQWISGGDENICQALIRKLYRLHSPEFQHRLNLEFRRVIVTTVRLQVIFLLELSSFHFDQVFLVCFCVIFLGFIMGLLLNLKKKSSFSSTVHSLSFLVLNLEKMELYPS